MSVEEEYWYDLLVVLSKYCTMMELLPIVIAFIYRKYFNDILKVFFFYALITLLLNSFEQFLIWISEFKDGYYFEMFGLENTFFIQVFFYLKNFILIGWYYSLIFSSKTHKKTIQYITTVLTCFTVIFLFLDGYKQFGLLMPCLNSIFLIVIPLAYLWESQKNSIRISLVKNPHFWLSIGLIVPNVLLFFLYPTGQYIYETNSLLYWQLNTFRLLTFILGIIFISIGFSRAYFARFIKTN